MYDEHYNHSHNIFVLETCLTGIKKRLEKMLKTMNDNFKSLDIKILSCNCTLKNVIIWILYKKINIF